ncbi:MAG: hypothetical protein IKG11_07555 [Atopobiaceae bacterium]|nr:hypothetical protein [Atopobiaceae bacterium]
MTNGRGDECVTKALVEDTISGYNGVKLAEADDNRPETLDLTVWKLDANGGEVVAGDNTEGTFAKSISYIVRMAYEDDSLLEGNLRVTKADGTTLLDKDTFSRMFDVAHEGDVIRLVVDEGFKIISASNAGEALTPDADGNYSIVVNRGGGIDLWAILSGTIQSCMPT